MIYIHAEIKKMKTIRKITDGDILIEAKNRGDQFTNRLLENGFQDVHHLDDWGVY